jgi:Domain of unknown function (DUF1844)
MTQPEEDFKITDRRRRDDAADEGGRPASSTAPSAARAAPTPARSEATAASDTDRSLVGLFMMLASSAVVAMGAAPDPLTGQVRRDLEQAADAIELLILLREKTQGNRTPEETRVLDEVIYDLQLRYVSARKVAG